MSIILKMSDIDKSFSGVQALKKCSFQLEEGEIHALVGENGAKFEKEFTKKYNFL